MSRPKPNTENIDLSTAFEGLLFDQDPMCIYVSIPSDLPSIASRDEAIQSIMERVEQNKRPAGQLKKALGKIVLYRQMLQEAVVDLVETYHSMTTPRQPRLSAMQQARIEMLKGLPDKVLKDYAAVYIDISDYILPDDRADLIAAVVKHFIVEHSTV